MMRQIHHPLSRLWNGVPNTQQTTHTTHTEAFAEGVAEAEHMH